MSEGAVFKGINGSLQLIVKEETDFSTIFTQIKAKLESAADFFTAGTVVSVPSNMARRLTPAEKEQLTGLFAKYGLTLTETNNFLQEQRVEKPVELSGHTSKQDQEIYETQTLIVARTVRGGQKIVYQGSIVVLGDVNPGAEIVAGGDIIILGTCRGVVHAGAYGNFAATVTAGRLLATQIRVAGLIARSPDHLDKSACIETARIEDGAVVIEPAN